MAKLGNSKSRLTVLRNYVWAILSLWTVFVVLVLLWSLSHETFSTEEVARIHARSAFEKDLVYRRWVAGHGGVYVPVTNQTPPNPYLSNVEERDITTPSGRALTLINPAYMTRQVHEMGAAQYGHRGHITSLNPIRPANAADEWETKALRAFEQGATEVSSVEELDNEEYLRLMRPMITEQACLKCHAEQGYKAGDLRGGISVSVPMAPLRAIARGHMATMALGHGLLWVLGLGGISLTGWHLKQRIRERDHAEEQIREQSEFLKSTIESLAHPFYVIDADDYTVKMANSAAQLAAVDGKSPCYALIHNKDRPCRTAEHPCPLETIKETKQPVTVEHIHYGKDGDVRSVEVHASPIFDREGNVIQMIEYCLDITERKRTEEALQKQREELRIIFDSVPAGIWYKDKENRFIRVNKAAAESISMKPEDIEGRLACELFPEEAEHYYKDDLEVIKSGKPKWGIVEKMQVPGGENKWVRTDKVPYWDEQGNVAGVIAFVVDITERKRAEEALQRAHNELEQRVQERTAELLKANEQLTLAKQSLQESEEKYRILVESAGESIATFDEDGVFLFLNEMSAKQLGGKPEDYVGKTMWDLFPKEIADRQAASVREVINTEQGMNQVVLTELQGQPRWFNTTLEPLRDSSGKVTAAMVVARDIHTLKQAEEELEMYRERIARAEQLASLGTLSATVAHELTQPLTVISLSIENVLTKLEATSSPETVIRRLNDSLTEISNITSIVERFRNFARRSSDEIVREIELGVVGERVVKLLNESARRAKITLHLNDMDKLPPVYSNEKDMEQLFFALTGNAIQAAEGKKGRELFISGAVKNEYIELSFSDNCGGVAPEDIDKIFEPFFTTKPKGQGTGLGLCVVQSIVSRAGGKIRVESKFGEGSTFFVTLPINKSTRS